MELTLSGEEVEIEANFSRFFEKQAPIARARAAAETDGFDRELWGAAAAAGLPTMGIDEEFGGGGASLLDLSLVAREVGRRLAPVPFVEATVAGRLLGRATGERHVEDISTGRLIPTLALASTPDGIAESVPAGAVADIVVGMVGRDLVAVESPPPPRQPNLAAQPVARRDLSETVTGRRVLASGARARALFDRAVTEWKILCAAELIGIQQEAQRIGVSYVLGRKVFGTQLGWFQAVQHRFAELATRGRGAELLALEAAWAEQGEPERLAELAVMAYVFGGEVAFQTCRESLQFHGGYGYTLEYDIQLYLRRAKALQTIGGPLRLDRERLAAAVLSSATREN